ncbi:hypothetical protein D5F01_LYC24039 [Larimichthys crocea]|uniref:Uncharacterized protein n=1 Tax=Larimichthys crocea TaxID=215358 RepID=A0A6G0HFW7_LARCR|nr:hypothetical protein D5F01_LYC24039 [Larimichthys crocea]
MSSSSELQSSTACASTGLRAPRRALSSNPEETSWLLSESVRDPIDNSRMVPVGVAVDCVRTSLSKDDCSRDKERTENERMAEWNRLTKDRLAQAALIKELGLEGAKAKMRQLQLHGASERDKSGSVMYRFECLIDRVFEYFQVKGMRMEPFQLELFRGVVLGVTRSQFGDALFKYKHGLLNKLGLAPLGSESYDHINPTLSHFYHVERTFSHYANPYTLCLAPRQCGKSLMMRLLLAAVLLHLDINVMVQAQNKHMCTTLRLGVESTMEELQQLPSFRHTENPVNICGNPENRVYRFTLVTRDLLSLTSCRPVTM